MRGRRARNRNLYIIMEFNVRDLIVKAMLQVDFKMWVNPGKSQCKGYKLVTMFGSLKDPERISVAIEEITKGKSEKR